jgi:multiple sugar transport system substrate-binding protein
MENAWLDLDPLAAETRYDLSDFHLALIDTLRSPGRGLEALPTAEFPSALFYNKALFDAAGIAYPPHRWESDFQGEPWTFDALRRTGMQLTLDASGRNAEDPMFRDVKIVQQGYYPQWPTDIRGQWTFLGAASLIGGDGRAVIPDIWRRAAEWYYRGMWTDHFIPTSVEDISLADLGEGYLASGLVAMVPQNTWLTCCFWRDKPIDWDVAAIPSFLGNRPVARLQADVFGILRLAKKPRASFDALALLMGEYAQDLLDVVFLLNNPDDFVTELFYYALPARTSLQPAAVEKKLLAFPDVDFQVFLGAMEYVDKPNHQERLPNPNASGKLLGEFQGLYESTPDLNLDRELDLLQERLQQAFDGVKSLW